MRVLLLPFGFYPDPVGGTEVYVEALAHELLGHGVEACIAAPGVRSEQYAVRGLPVHRYALTTAPLALTDQYGAGDPQAAREFAGILNEVRPDIVHLHALTSGVSLGVARAAKAAGIPVVFTYHTPTVTCVRGTLLRWGSELCDGAMSSTACSACSLQKHGLPRWCASPLASCSRLWQPFLAGSGVSGSLWTALRMTELVQIRHDATRALFTEVDHVVAVCQWVRDLLVRNGLPETKLSVSRQGLARPTDTYASKASRRDDGTLRLAFLGRLDPTKGVHILIQALRQLPGASIRLDVFGISQGIEGRHYEAILRKRASGDDRIRFQAAVPADAVTTRLREYDLLAVPSQWMETGPLVVYEAFAAGVPVIGSDLGGIAELVQEGTNGLLVPHDDVAAWVVALKRLATEPALLAKLRNGISPPRTMCDAAMDMVALYENIVCLKAR